MSYQKIFRMPKPVNISGRSSSITNSFINSIIPVIKPSEEEIKQALDILNMTQDTFQCAYCGDRATEWDHFRPLVINKKPTGYISEINNLVPACGKCNQSKGNKDWLAWMTSKARLSPKTKGVSDLDERIDLLKTYENWGKPTVIDFEEIVGKEMWEKHWGNWEKVQQMLRESQVLAKQINQRVRRAHNKNDS